jgi:hypothetical protein
MDSCVNIRPADSGVASQASVFPTMLKRCSARMRSARAIRDSRRIDNDAREKSNQEESGGHNCPPMTLREAL